MNDDSLVKIMQSLDLDYSKAIMSTLHFSKSIESLNKQLAGMKGISLQSAKDINAVFASQLGQVTGNKTLVDQFGKPFQTIESQAKTASASIGAMANSYKNTTLAAQQHGNAVKGVADQYNIFASEWQRRSSWFLTGTLFYGIINGAKEAASTIKEVEMGMVELARVMDDSTFVLEDYRDELFQLGIDYGQTFENVQQIALRWAQSGYNVADSLELTKTSLLALNTAELNAKNATESMIGIMAQWQLQAEDLALVMDKINITADNYSITSQDLVDGLLRSSGAARVMNVSLDETIGLLTVMREASGRTGREVGNALNSILSYVQRPSAINTFERMGIQVFADEAKTQFRNAMEIFRDIAVNWGSLSADIQDGFVKAADDAELFNEELAVALGMQKEWNSLQQRDIAQASAGVHRRNYFIGMIERMANVQGVLNNMMDASGYSIAENEKTMEALEKKVDSLKAAMEQLAVAIGDAGLADALKLLIDAGTGALELFNSMPDEIQKPILAFGTMYLALKTGQQALKVFGFANNVAAKSMKDLADATTVATTATNKWLLIISAATAVISAIYSWNKKNNEEMEKSIEVFQRQKEVSNSISELLPQYEALASKSSLTTDEQTKLLDIKQKITNLLPETKQALDNENMSLETQLQIIKDLNAEELERAKRRARETLEKYEGQYDFYIKEVEEAEKALKHWTAVYEEFYQKRDTLAKKEQIDMRNARLLIDAQSERLEVNKNKIQAVDSARELYNDTLENENKLLDDNTDKNNENANLKEKQAQSMDKLAEAFNKSTSTLQTYYSILDEVNSKQGLSSRTLMNIIEKHQELLPYLSDEQELRKQLINIISKEEETQRTAYANMLMASEEFFNFKIKGNQELVNRIKEVYDIDLSNHKNLAQAKLEVEQRLLEKLTSMWSRYYNAQTGTLTYDLAELQRVDPQQADQVLEQVRNYKRAMAEFDSIALDLGEVDLSKINASNIKSKSAENKELNNALKLLEHRKRISVETQDSIKKEIEELHRINSLYAKTEDERMNMAERIYAAEKRLKDKRLQDSIDYINEKKNLDQLTAEEEIYLWEKVLITQSDNINAVKQATLNLHKLRQQLNQETAQKEENSIQHLTTLGIYSTQQQIDKYRELHSLKTSSLDEERKHIEQLFSLYKSLLSEQQKAIKDAYDERLRQIEAEASRRKAAQEDVIRGIEIELKLLERQEDAYDHNKNLASLREELAYWQVRTSEEARKKVAELTEQIAEEEHKREVELKKQSLEDKKQVAQDEIRVIDDVAKKEREKWEKSYDLVMKSFDEHSTNIVARAAAMSKEAYQEWERNYLTPLQTALANANYGSFNSIAWGLESSLNDFASTWDNFDNNWDTPTTTAHDWGMSESDYQRFKENGWRWAELEAQGYKQATNAEMQKLNAENDALRIKYGRDPALGEKPKFHKGAKTLSYGVAEFMPGEYVFPPDLSKKMDGLLEFLKSNPVYQSNSNSYSTDKRVIIQGPLYNSERTVFEDNTDEASFARELQRALLAVR